MYLTVFYYHDRNCLPRFLLRAVRSCLPTVCCVFPVHRTAVCTMCPSYSTLCCVPRAQRLHLPVRPSLSYVRHTSPSPPVPCALNTCPSATCNTCFKTSMFRNTYFHCSTFRNIRSQCGIFRTMCFHSSTVCYLCPKYSS